VMNEEEKRQRVKKMQVTLWYRNGRLLIHCILVLWINWPSLSVSKNFVVCVQQPSKRKK
jgi:hypothetical protein